MNLKYSPYNILANTKPYQALPNHNINNYTICHYKGTKLYSPNWMTSWHNFSSLWSERWCLFLSGTKMIFDCIWSTLKVGWWSLFRVIMTWSYLMPDIYPLREATQAFKCIIVNHPQPNTFWLCRQLIENFVYQVHFAYCQLSSEILSQFGGL